MRLLLGESMVPMLLAIRENRLTAERYRELAGGIDGGVADIVAQCRLPVDADAQLQIVVANLLVGASQMKGMDTSRAPREGVLKVVAALDDHGRYFDDPGFRPPGLQ